MLSPLPCMFYVKWSLLEHRLFRGRQAENTTQVCRRRDRKSWMCCEGGYAYTAFNHRWTKTSWAAGGVVQKVGGRTPETQPLMEGTCTDNQHRLLHCPAGGLSFPVLWLPDPPGFILLLEGKEEFGGSFVPPDYFTWMRFELTVVNNGHLKGLGRMEGKQAYVSVVWEAAQALRICINRWC